MAMRDRASLSQLDQAQQDPRVGSGPCRPSGHVLTAKQAGVVPGRRCGRSGGPGDGDPSSPGRRRANDGRIAPVVRPRAREVDGACGRVGQQGDRRWPAVSRRSPRAVLGVAIRRSTSMRHLPEPEAAGERGQQGAAADPVRGAADLGEEDAGPGRRCRPAPATWGPPRGAAGRGRSWRSSPRNRCRSSRIRTSSGRPPAS